MIELCHCVVTLWHTLTIAANEACDHGGDIPAVQNAVYIHANSSEHPECSECSITSSKVSPS